MIAPMPFAWHVTLWMRGSDDRKGRFEGYVTKMHPFRVRHQIASLDWREVVIVGGAPITEAEFELAIETGIEEWT